MPTSSPKTNRSDQHHFTVFTQHTTAALCALLAGGWTRKRYQAFLDQIVDWLQTERDRTKE